MTNWEEIVKKLSTLPPEQWEQLYAGLPENERKEIEQAIRLWKASQENGRPFPIDKEGDWNTLLQKIQTTKVKETPTIRMKVWLKWAAVLLPIAFVTYSIFFRSTAVPGPFVVITGNHEIRQVVLPDSTRVTLNENSTLIYPKKFSGEHRGVMFTGEAWFEVKQNPSLPFIIEGRSTSVTVLGTSFNYKDTKEETSLFLVSGKVAFVTNTRTDSTVLQKGEEARFDSITGKLHTARYENENFLAWKTGVLKFDDVPLNEVMEQLEQYYHTEIIADESTFKECRFTGKFERQSRKEVLKILTSMYSLQVEEDPQGNIRLKGKGCNNR